MKQIKFKLEGITAQNEKIKLSKPIWFELSISNFGSNVRYKFFFLEPISQKITQLKIQLNEEPGQIFIVDKIEQTRINNKFTIFKLIASDPISLIWQNYVQPETFESLSVNEFFEKFCKPFQINSINPTLQNCTPSNFFTTLGMTYWNTIYLFFKKNFNTTIFIDKNKQITTKFRCPTMPSLNINNNYLTNFNAITDRTKIISTVMIQFPDDNPTNFHKVSHENKIAEKLKINRIKVFKLPKQFMMLPNTGAKAIIEYQNATHKIIEMEFAKTLNPIYPGTIIEFNDGNKKTDLCVKSFKTAIFKNGPFSKISFFYSELLN